MIEHEVDIRPGVSSTVVELIGRVDHCMGFDGPSNCIIWKLYGDYSHEQLCVLKKIAMEAFELGASLTEHKMANYLP